MKKLFILSVVMLSFNVYSQRVTTKTGDVSTTVTAQDVIKTFNLDVKKPKTEEQLIGKAVLTKHTVIYKEVTYPVYQTSKGKLFFVYPNKDQSKGWTKRYLKEEDQQ